MYNKRYMAISRDITLHTNYMFRVYTHMHTRIPTSKYACTHEYTANSDVYRTILQKIVRENTRIYENICERVFYITHNSNRYTKCVSAHVFSSLLCIA